MASVGLKKGQIDSASGSGFEDMLGAKSCDLTNNVVDLGAPFLTVTRNVVDLSVPSAVTKSVVDLKTPSDCHEKHGGS